MTSTLFQARVRVSHSIEGHGICTEREMTMNAIDTAREILESAGRCKGDLYLNGRYCLIGALGKALGQDAALMGDQDHQIYNFIEDAPEIKYVAEEARKKYLGRIGRGATDRAAVYLFNDADT